MPFQFLPLALSAISGGIKYGIHSFMKPKRIKANTDYVDNYIDNLRSDMADASYRNTVVQAASRNAGALVTQANRNRETQNRITGLEGSGLDAEEMLKTNQDVIGETNKIVMDANVQENQRLSGLSEGMRKAMMLRDQIIEEVRQRNEDAAAQWEAQGKGILLETAGNVLQSGVTEGFRSIKEGKLLEQKLNAYKALGKIAPDMDIKAFKEMYNTYGDNLDAVLGGKQEMESIKSLNQIFGSIPGVGDIVNMITSNKLDRKTGIDLINDKINQYQKDMKTPFATIESVGPDGTKTVRNVFPQDQNWMYDQDISDNPQQIKSITQEKPITKQIANGDGTYSVWQRSADGTWSNTGEKIGSSFRTEYDIEGNDMVQYRIGTDGKRTEIKRTEMKPSRLSVRTTQTDYMNKPPSNYTPKDWKDFIVDATSQFNPAQDVISVKFKTEKTGQQTPKNLAIKRNAAGEIIGLTWMNRTPLTAKDIQNIVFKPKGENAMNMMLEMFMNMNQNETGAEIE